MKKTHTYTSAEVSEKLGISKDTLLRWFRTNKISPVPRDERGWRTFTEEDIAKIIAESHPLRPDLQSGSGSQDIFQQGLLFDNEAIQIPLNQNPIRPIQYMGSKFRVLDQIGPYLRSVTPAGGVFLDAFTGTTCVAQTMLDHATVITNDVMVYAKVFADVFVVGPSRGDLPLIRVTDLQATTTYQQNKAKLLNIYSELIDIEDQILFVGDGQALHEYSHQIPTVWRKNTNSSGIQKSVDKLISSFSPNFGEQDSCSCLFCTYYAGSYFGLRQSIEIDSLRTAIDAAEKQGMLSAWQAKAMLCALMTAMSSAVSAVGKHFAQPILTPDSSPKKAFSINRCLFDRKISIPENMDAAINELNSRTFALRGNNRSLMIDIETIDQQFLTGLDGSRFLHSWLRVPKVDCIYADPPYTAQQYSRFYHILETVCRYDYPRLQMKADGKVTRGLYREGKHLSAFCSVSKSPAAFESLLRMSKALSSVLVLSYSESRAATGNRRMITPAQLKSLANIQGFSVDSVSLTHSYRPLNRAEKILDESDEVEQLYIFKEK
ncbi:MAG: DNA adenine methylase [Victivallaceae bacterium]|nr:DNA adenine methylase [Victivallaceae bacterium]